jgi:alpha-mannosidase
MALNPEWRRRIDMWMKAMPSMFFKPLGNIAFDGFVTKEQLTAEQALKRKFTPMPTGTEWGGKWDYGWFKGSVRLTKEAAGERIAMRVNVGGEAAIMINGMNFGANDIGHKEITLTRKAKGGETFDILVESYAGHGPRKEGGGPCPHGHEMVPEPPATQVKAGISAFGIWEEELFQLNYDMETLFQLRDSMADQESLRVAEIDDALMKATLIIDLELPRAEMLKTVRKGCELLKPLLEKKNGPTSPRMTCFGHSHIDVAWLWPLQETERKCCRTFSSQLALMEEYPEYKYLQSQPHLYQMVKTKYPALYQRIKKAVKSGRWIPDGGMWVEADTNISGGESLIRQFIHGKRFFRDEFGVENELMWLPDVFGYSGALPQIMQGCGIKYFSTQKIFWTYNGGDPFPYNIFNWVGIDGTKVLSYLHNDYNSQTYPKAIMSRWNERVQKGSEHNARLVPFGWGDGGGGPTRDHLEFLRRERDLEGLPRCEIEPPADYFQNLDTSKLPSWVGELYFQAHRGTYTSQAKTKQGNRLSELGLREAELWGAAASAIASFKFPLKKADALWKDVLLNQFHDIIPGSSIHRVYEEAEAAYALVIKEAASIAGDAKKTLVKNSSDAITVFNSLSWKRDSIVELPAGFANAETANGEPLATQGCGGKIYAKVNDIPACGWLSISKSSKKSAVKSAVKAGKTVLENELLKITLNSCGEITSIIDKGTGEEFAAGPCNSFKLYKDVPGWFDAWDIDSMYKQQPVEIERNAALKVVASGPICAAVELTRSIGSSKLTQKIILRSGSRRIDFKTTVDWKESHKLLKVNFPVTIHNDDALHDIQFGYVKRPTHATRPYDAGRFEVCNHKWTALTEESRTAAVLNDCKYGVNVEGNSINLTLLRSPLAPDMTADKGIQEFTYAFYCGNGPFMESGVIQQAYELNVPVTSISGHAETASLLSLDAGNVIIETVKPAEDASGDVVIRLYESAHNATQCNLTVGLPFEKVFETNMLESDGREIEVKNGSISLRFRPFEIKTLRLKVR